LLFVFKDHVANYISQDPRVDQEIIDSIDQAYFNDDQTFDIVEYDLTVSSCHLHGICLHTKVKYIYLFPCEIKLEIYLFAQKLIYLLSGHLRPRTR